MVLDDSCDTFLHHYVDQVFFVTLEDDCKEKQTCCLLIRHRACLEKIHFVADQEVPSRVHEHFSVNLWRVLLKHECCVEERDGLKAQWVASTER